ncbi:hypothetical protein JTB14_007591 [Gonioctena quinquepunctata]|nr:hypothetical protein JTB14_007591 [Gonioctena quinquepunctata]
MPNAAMLPNTKWYTDELKQEKNDLDNAFHKYRQSSSICLARIYKIKRKNYRKSLRNAKREELNGNICSADNKIKQTWREVNSKLGRMNHETRDVHLNINNVEVIDPEIAANCFGEYFSSIIEEKMKEHFESDRSQICTAGEILPHTFFFRTSHDRRNKINNSQPEEYHVNWSR